MDPLTHLAHDAVVPAVWSLHGLDECLAARGETVERPHVQVLLAQALARSEVRIRASCFCRA